MNLSQEAITELREILKKDIGENTDALSDENLNEFGEFLLTATATSLKIRSRK